ncbi:MAG: phosphoribosylformylglycinamidine cyclo-ligase [Candidatus Micrarchaeia archaeon]
MVRYSDVGIDIGRVGGIHKRINRMIAKTKNKYSLHVLGHYAGLLKIGNINLAIHTDGVGTKVLVAQQLDKYDTIGIDCVAMNVNDIICVGAEPIALVDYIALEREDAELVSEITKGLVKGAREAGSAIVGGETAIMGNVIRGIEGKTGFDLAATCVGIVRNMIIGDKMRAGDLVVGVESSGIHSNGLTLARKVLPQERWHELLKPTRIYVKPALDVCNSVEVHGLAHITGGAFSKMRRIGEKAGMRFILDGMPKQQKIFEDIAERADLGDYEMYRTFNMGVGFCIICGKKDAEEVIGILKKYRMRSWIIGHAEKGRGVCLVKEGKKYELA